MSTAMKRCVQCGMLKDEEDFRKYTYSINNNTKGTYRLCKSCEAINSQYVKAKKQVQEHPSDDKYFLAYCEISKLYDILEARGLRTPRNKVAESTMGANPAVNKLLEFYQETKVVPKVPTQQDLSIPTDLQEWLDADRQSWIDAGLSPEFLQETIYESLKAKYRPQIGVDKETFLPIYDNAFKDTLNKILRRFDEYEEYMSVEDITDD